MRCHSSIWRWSPRLGLCLSKSIGPARCTTYGPIVFVCVPGVPSISRCHCAARPSPRQERMPMPVIQAWRSAMARDRERKGELARPGFDVRAELIVGERRRAEPDLGLAYRLALAGEPRLGDGETRALVHEGGFARERLARRDEPAQLEPVRADEERHAFEIGERD